MARFAPRRLTTLWSALALLATLAPLSAYTPPAEPAADAPAEADGIDPATAERPVWTRSPIAASSALGLLFVSDRDAGAIVALDASNGHRRWRTRVGAQPGMLDLVPASEAGAWELIVTCEGSGEIWSLDPVTGAVHDSSWVGVGPRGFAPLSGRRLAVALYLEHEVVVWDLDARQRVAEHATQRFPTAVQPGPDEQTLYITSFFGRDIDVVDLAGGTRRQPLRAAAQANQISTLMALGETLVVPHIIANTRQPDLHLANTIFPVVSYVPMDGTPPKVLNFALLGEVVNGPEALLILPRRQLLLTANSRSNDLSALSLDTELSAGLVEVGRYPVGLVADESETYAYVVNAFDHTISVVDLESLREVARWSYGDEVLPAQLARGRDLFHDADSLRLVLNQWVSCSNCHPAGLSDGRVWRLPGRPPLRTKSLADFAQTRPGGWLASFDEMQDEELFIREFFLGLGLSDTAPYPHLGEPNEGLSADLDALSDYVYSLRTAPSPFLRDGALSEAAQRGEAIFLSQKTACVTCHPPPLYTVSTIEEDRRVENPIRPLLLDETKQMLLRPKVVAEAEERLATVDVPSLVGLYREPRFLHDGRAETIYDIFATWNPDDRHGVTSHLTEQQLRDLEQFILSLPYGPMEGMGMAAPTPAGSAEDSATASATGSETAPADAR